jgi:hypothetical protein
MAEQKALVTLKDGTKIEIKDLAELSKYSDRQDLDSISFFGDEQQIVKQEEKMDAGVQEMVAVVEQPKADPVIPKPQPAEDHATAITATIGALAGAVSSAGTPALMNLAKSFIKGKLKVKGKSGDSKPEEEKEEPTDCKTHQVKASAKFASLSARLSALEGKENEKSSLFNKETSIKDLEERIEKLEKLIKNVKSKNKK